MRKLALLMSVLLVLTAGSAYALPAQMDAPMLTTYDLIASADKQLDDSKSFEMDAKLTLAMAAEGESFKMEADIAGKFIVDPLTAKVSLKMDMEPAAIENVSGDIYLRTEGSDVVMYIAAEGEVYKMSLSAMTAMMGDMFDMDELLSDHGIADAKSTPLDYEKLAYVGETQVNGRDVYVIEAQPKIPADVTTELDEFMANYGSHSNVEIYSILKALNNLSFTCYIDQKTYQYARIEMDLSGIMQKIFADMGAASYGVSISEYSIVIDFKNINKVKAFDVPKSIVSKAENVLGPYSSSGIIGGSDGPTSVYTSDDEAASDAMKYYDKIDWDAIMELDEADLAPYVDVDGNVDYAGLAAAYPA